MPLMQIQSEQIGDGGVHRDDLNTTTSGQAVIRKVVAGTGISLSSTGADTGTGDVTITATGVTEYGRIANYGGETDASGWSASGANFTIARTTTSGEVLRGTGSLELTANGSQAVNDYISHSFTLDLGDRNRMLAVEFYFKGTSNFDSGDCDVVFHDGTNEIIPSITQIPGGEGYFQATWVSTSASSYTIRFKAKVTTAFSFVIDDVFVGADEVVRGAVIGPWESFTPTFSASLGTVTNIAMWKRRVGSNLEIKGRFTTGTLTTGAGTMTIGGHLLDTTMASSYKTAFGILTRLTSGTLAVVYDGTYTFNVTYDGANADRVEFVSTASSNTYQSLNASSIVGSNEVIDVVFMSIPIDGWTSDVIVSSPSVEHAYNSDTSNNSDTGTSNFAYGINGGLVPTVSSTTKTKRIGFQYPSQPGDLVQLWIKKAGRQWAEVASTEYGKEYNSGYYGVALEPVSGSLTEWDVYFYPNGADLVNGASSWSTENSAGTRWKVIKSSNPRAVETSDKVVQVVYEEITSSGTFSSAQIPFDDTIPQNTEGAELLTATITPRYANSYLYVEAQAFVGENTDSSNGAAMALFRDSTADAFATSFSVAQSSASSPFGTSIIAIPLRAGKRLNSVAPAPTTIKMRIGLDEVATVRYNGATGSRRFGGSLVSYLKIIEVRA